MAYTFTKSTTYSWHCGTCNLDAFQPSEVTGTLPVNKMVTMPLFPIVSGVTLTSSYNGKLCRNYNFAPVIFKGLRIPWHKRIVSCKCSTCKLHVPFARVDSQLQGAHVICTCRLQCRIACTNCNC